MDTATTAPHDNSFRRRYFGDAKPALLGLFDPRGLRILDLGCGGGHNGALLKQAGARWVCGVERDADACAEARRRLDSVIEADLADFDPPLLARAVRRGARQRRARARPLARRRCSIAP